MPTPAKMPVPSGEMSPQKLCNRIRDWAEAEGLEYTLTTHSSEFGKVVLKDPEGKQTVTIVPNAHHGRKLKKHQIRYTIKDLNKNWEE